MLVSQLRPEALFLQLNQFSTVIRLTLQISAGTYVVERSWGGHSWGSTARKSVMDIRGGNVVCGGADKSIDIPVVARPKLVRERRL